MSLDHLDKIDAIGFETATGQVVLSLLDSWDWADARHHLLALQAKLNAYFEFIESKQILEAYPQAVGRALRIEVASRYPLPDEGKRLLSQAAAVALELDVQVTQRVV